jgi:hypothetical protein
VALHVRGLHSREDSTAVGLHFPWGLDSCEDEPLVPKRGQPSGAYDRGACAVGLHSRGGSIRCEDEALVSVGGSASGCTTAKRGGANSVTREGHHSMRGHVRGRKIGRVLR